MPARLHLRSHLLLLIAFSALAPGLPGQPASPAAEEETPAIVRPEASDAPSLRLISNYLAASGGRAAHVRLDAVSARGTVKEGRLTRDVEVVETRDGKRFIRYTWKHGGRWHETIEGSDGTSAWRQDIRPKKGIVQEIGGRDGERFVHHRWFYQPFTGPAYDRHVFEYRGDARVGGRPAYLVLGYGPDNVRTWFHFDKKTFLVTRYGGVGVVAGVEEYLDYLALEYRRVGGVLVPSRLEFLAENATYGKAVFEEIEANPEVDPDLFVKPESNEVWLRQRVPSS